MTDPQEAVEAAKKALADAEAALAAATEAAKAEAAKAEQPEPAQPTPAVAADAPLDAERVASIRAGYAMEGAVLEMGALVNGEALPEVPVRIPIAMTNRHGLVAGATGTGKT